MPKKAIDYSNAVIYKICCKDLKVTDVYVGSTTNLAQRRSKHKYVCNNEKIKIIISPSIDSFGSTMVGITGRL